MDLTGGDEEFASERHGMELTRPFMDEDDIVEDYDNPVFIKQEALCAENLAPMHRNVSIPMEAKII